MEKEGKEIKLQKVKERKKEGEESRNERNHNPINFNGLLHYQINKVPKDSSTQSFKWC
jgi:hypothetical protein